MLSVPANYTIYQYLLALDPHEELRNRVMQIRQQFYKTYRNTTALYGNPHLTLLTFTRHEMMESRIIQRLKNIATGHCPTKIELKDYGSFPSHTIYINVTSKIPIQNLVKKIRAETQKLMKPDDDNKPHFILEPHITIARKLSPWQYEKGWLEYSHKHFTGRFIANDMLLLKRSVGELKYQIVKRFEFQNLTESTKQGELFM